MFYNLTNWITAVHFFASNIPQCADLIRNHFIAAIRCWKSLFRSQSSSTWHFYHSDSNFDQHQTTLMISISNNHAKLHCILLRLFITVYSFCVIVNYSSQKSWKAVTIIVIIYHLVYRHILWYNKVTKT